MTAAGLTWAAHLVAAAELDKARLWGHALGWTLARSDDTVVAFTAPDGSLIEFCGPDYPVAAHLFANGPTVTGFLVDDLDTATGRLVAAGFSLLSERAEGGGVAFVHFSGPGDRVLGLIQQL